MCHSEIDAIWGTLYTEGAKCVIAKLMQFGGLSLYRRCKMCHSEIDAIWGMHCKITPLLKVIIISSTSEGAKCVIAKLMQFGGLSLYRRCKMCHSEIDAIRGIYYKITPPIKSNYFQ